MSDTLYHFTCAHGYVAIGDKGNVRPMGVRGPSQLAWFTDLPKPARDWVGLTSHILTCDRLAYRYRVTDASNVTPWVTQRRKMPFAPELESTPHARPAHWFVSSFSVPVVLDPLEVAS